MLHGIDHVVILVPDLDAAVEAYTRLGFSVVPGGRHNVATHNALIALQDGAYIELIAFWEDAPRHRWHRFRGLGGGLVDYCMRTDDLDGDVAALRSAGIAMSERQPMSRLRPDGYRLEWALSLATETQGVTPFLIEDVTPREERVPGETQHANRATGIATLTIAVSDQTVVQLLAGVMADEGKPVRRDDIRGEGMRFVNGGHAFDFVVPAGRDEVAQFLENRDGKGGAFALSLKTAGQEEALEPSRACNARLSLVRG
jgi:catechol 2,3-dioxygenase-like lactoylglutathione lyase family enzyme